MNEASRQEQEAIDEARDRVLLLTFCYTEDEYYEVQHGIVPDQVRRRAEHTQRTPYVPRELSESIADYWRHHV